MTLLKKLLLGASVAMGLSSSVMAAELKVGDDAPAFELKASDGKTYKLADFKDKQTVIVAWFPKAFTGGCTKECKSLKETGKSLKAFNVAYFTASCDTVEKNTDFAKSLDLDYPILSDPERKAALDYGLVADKTGNAKRWTFVVGKDGKIKHIFGDKEVNTAEHGPQLVEVLTKLKVEKK
jgi:peroxiredoxin Q/BCP